MTIPADIALRLRELGTGFNQAEVQALYAPLLAEQRRDGSVRRADLRYGPHERHALDLYVPEPRGIAACPIIVFLHGGGFIRGDKNNRANVGWFFARRGYVTVVPNYRLAPAATWPSGPQDVRRLVSWLRENVTSHGGDPERMFLMGESAGAAHVAAAVLLRRFQVDASCGVRGAVLISGPYNARLEGMARPQFGIATPDPRNEAYFGADAATWAEASIIDHVDTAPLPLLISFAERDLLQMQVQAGELFARLVTDHGFAPELLYVRDHNHFSQGTAINTGDESLTAPILAFVAHHCV